MEQERNNFSNSTIKSSTCFSLRGKQNKLKWDLVLLLIIKILVLILTAFFLNANVQYVVVKDLKLIFNVGNMLNLNNTNIPTIIKVFTESMVSIMPISYA
jgi:hypothetical protein